MPRGKKMAVVVKPAARVPRKKQMTTPPDESDSQALHSSPPPPPLSPSPPESENEEPTKKKKTTKSTPAVSVVAEEVPDEVAGPSKRKKKQAVLLTEEQEVELGEWLRNHPELYSKGLKGYHETSKKNKLWEDKAAELKLESGALLKTWYESIRTKIGKMTNVKSGSAMRDPSERDLFLKQNFLFLSDHICRMRGKTACSLKSAIEQSTQQSTQGDVESSDSEMEANIAEGSDIGSMVDKLIGVTTGTLPESTESTSTTRPRPSAPSTFQRQSSSSTTGQPATKGGKGGKGKKTPATQNEQLVTGLVDEIRTQREETSQMTSHISQLLNNSDMSSEPATWGMFLGKLCARMHPDLREDYYRESLDHALNFLQRSRMMRPLPPLPVPVPPQPEYPSFEEAQQRFYRQQQQQQQQPQQQQQQPTLTSLLPPPPGSSSSSAPPASSSIQQSSLWNTAGPTAGQVYIQPSDMPRRPAITPNMSVSGSSLPRLSDLSQLMTPDNPEQRLRSPSDPDNTGAGGFFQ